MTQKIIWQSAMTFTDLCDLTVELLQSSESNLHSETTQITSELVKLNKNGFMTDSSQPAGIGEDWKQRAYVLGFALKETAFKIATLTLSTDLYVNIAAPNEESGAYIPVTQQDFQPFTWCGFSFKSFEHYNELNKNSLTELSQAWHVCVIDMEWGRKKYLWNELIKVLTTETQYSIKPHPDLGLGDQEI